MCESNDMAGNEEDERQSRSSFCWWRGVPEFQDRGGGRRRLNPDLDTLTPSPTRLILLRELERLALVAEQGLDELRHKLITYRSGDFWLPTGGFSKPDMDVPPLITILLLGLSGSGKSSVVNLMYSVLGRSGLIPFAQTSRGSSNYTTMFLEEHNILRSMRSGFCVYDSRGLDLNRMREGMEEMSSWMVDGVRHYQPCSRPDGDPATAPPIGCQLSSARFTPRPVNCALLVVNLAETTRAFNDHDLKPLEATRELFRSPAIRKSNENPLLILTHGDLLTPEERINGRLKLCDYLGVSEATGAYDIPCLTEQGILPEESDPVISYALAEAIYRALIQSDRTHLPVRRPKDWPIIAWSWIMCSIAAIFASLAYFFSNIGQKKIHRR